MSNDHQTYRVLASECRRQAILASNDKAQQALEQLAHEYDALADWLERHATPGQSTKDTL
jgi:hypothetical protein